MGWGLMTVKFLNGTSYTYSNVKRGRLIEFVKTTDPGNYYIENIKGIYPSGKY
ncbi:MAG: KTSC domain-containing protein [Deltaproteobacteria bacterium]|nr:KTSC domain-containing protein [Deltaproteobacteria bacterium]